MASLISRIDEYGLYLPYDASCLITHRVEANQAIAVLHNVRVDQRLVPRDTVQLNLLFLATQRVLLVDWIGRGEFNVLDPHCAVVKDSDELKVRKEV